MTVHSEVVRLETAIEALTRWLVDHDYEAYDPGDGQLSPLRFLTGNRPILQRVLTAAVLRAPFNVRPMLGIRAHRSTKGMGYIAWGFIKRYAWKREGRYEQLARNCLDWLIKHRAPGQQHYCWGNHFAFSTRAGTIPAGEPTIVWSSLIGQAFLEASMVLGEEKYFDVAQSVSEWILTLPREKTKMGICLSYVGFKQSSIHNSNMLGAALLAQTGKRCGNAEALEVAHQAMLYSCNRQNEDGAWFYGEDPKYHWIDNFHTGYNLDSLKRYSRATGDGTFKGVLERGYQYFKQNFFENNGRPKYYHDRIFPTDIQCSAQAIDTLTYFAEEDASSLGVAQQVADWTIKEMQDKDGHFYYRDLGWTKNRTAMLHWGQGTMLKALTHLASRLDKTQPTRSREVPDIIAAQ
jgi:hypothetical protein